MKGDFILPFIISKKRIVVQILPILSFDGEITFTFEKFKSDFILRKHLPATWLQSVSSENKAKFF